MHVFTVLVPKLLDIIEFSTKKKDILPARKMDSRYKTILKDASGFKGSSGSFKSILLGQKSMLKKSESRFVGTGSQPQTECTQDDQYQNPNLNDLSMDASSIPHLIAAIKKALAKVDEDPVEALQLLNYVVMPDLAAQSSTQFKPGTRTTLLGRLLARIIDKVSENRPLALIVDDIQWFFVF